jgi:drug/metabolite transporter (DMT)-like permease
MAHALSRRKALLLFAIVVVSWGLNWVVTKELVRSATPLWAVAIRSAVGTVALLILLVARRQFIVPRRGDWPVVLATGLLHMVAFSTLVAVGLRFIPAGRSIVLGYTTPLWVAPGAWLLLHEPMPKARIIGIVMGLAGLAAMFNPFSFDWANHGALIGNAVILLAALCWAASILYVRVHHWIASPFQLLFWQALLATIVLAGLALAIDGIPRITWTALLAANFLYGGVFGIAVAYWAMNMVNRSLPATTTSLGILATPVVGVIASAVIFNEAIEPSLIFAMAMILGGIAVGTIPFGNARRSPLLQHQRVRDPAKLRP